MPETLITGPEPLQSWWLPDEESRKNGWGPRHEVELRQKEPNQKKRSKTSRTHNEADEKMRHSKSENQVSYITMVI